MFEEIKQALATSLEVSNVLDPSRLPEYAKQSVEFLKSDTPDEIQLMVLNLKTAQMLSYNRIKFSWEKADIIWKVLMNLYWINFLESWWWKDKTIQSIDYYLLDFFKEKFKSNSDKYVEAESEKLVKLANVRFGNAKWQAAAYIKEHAPRPFVKELWDATAEWFEVNRQQLYKAGFWSMFISIDEVSLYIKSMKTETVSFFRSLISSYEWNYTPKVIKSEVTVTVTEWVPNNVLMYSSLWWLLSGQTRDRFMEFLEIWFARRSFLCYPDPIKKVSYDSFEAYKKKKSEKKSNKVDPIIIKNKLRRAFEATDINKDITTWKFDDITFQLIDDKAVDYYEMYKLYCKHRSEFIENNIQKIEIRERSWRMLKLATLIAVIEHPNKREITKKDLEYAIYQTEFFGKQAQKFFNDEQSDVEELYKFIVKEWPVKRTFIRDALRPVNKNRFKERFDKIKYELEDYCDDCWMVLKGVQWKAKLYSISAKWHNFEKDIDEINKFIWEIG